ncbi:MAG: hypothetical protein JSR37_06225 [Verrucomicrobia bacterium]|nr:hypothetical protein [Verrucomicrobiota bacterium]MBS0636136.1 hypothetical protein [Verrucomicrobiota bacterium]
MWYNSLLCLLVAVAAVSTPLAGAGAKSGFQIVLPGTPPDDCSDTTKKAYEQFTKLDHEIGHFGVRACELILHCSYLQDALLAYLHNAETVEEFHRGMALFQANSKSLKSVSTYITSVFNFYTAAYEPPEPQEVSIRFNDKEVNGFLNTFKLKSELTSQERERYFHQEYTHYLRDATAYPFVLDAESVNQLEAATVYNFALLPDGTIYAALERPGDREYQVRDEVVMEAFRYPNHTILAGAPDQAVVTAGALIQYVVGDKRLFFISSKSGHFQPTYASLEHMKEQLSHLGVEPATVVAVPDLNMAAAVIKTYKGAQVPLLLTQSDATTLFGIAKARWDSFFATIDRNLIQELADGTNESLTDELKLVLKKQRAESTYMRSAYNLFSKQHRSPPEFGEFVKRFGKLKDASKRYNTPRFNPKKVQETARELLERIDYKLDDFTPADDESLAEQMKSHFDEMLYLLALPSLDPDEYHTLKKLSREAGTLFMNMAEAVKTKGRGYFIYTTAAEGFLQINDLMAGKDFVVSELDPSRVQVPKKIANLLLKYISHIGIAPYHIHFSLDPKETWWIVNNAKEVYFVASRCQDIFYNIAEGHDDATMIDKPRTLRLLQIFKRDLERARNILIYLDASHKEPDTYAGVFAAIEEMKDAVIHDRYDWIKSHAESFYLTCYYGVSLQSWQCTDEASFYATLEASLQPLYDVQAGNRISQEKASAIMREVQAFYDYVNLNRQNGLFRSENPHTLPMVCFDALEEAADTLYIELEACKELAEEVVITPRMEQNAHFILSRVATQGKLP